MAIFIEVFVEEHEEIPEGCGLRFRVVSGGAAPRPVKRILYAPEGEEAPTEWLVEAPGGESKAALVEDSGAGSATLIFGGDRGLRLRDASGRVLAEPYLLLSEGAILE